MSVTEPYMPLLAVTMGDPAGIGPEIAVKTFSEDSLYSICRPLLIGHIPTLLETLAELELDFELNPVHNISEAKFNTDSIDVIPIGEKYPETVQKSVVSAVAGDIAFEAVKKAIDLAMRKEVDATVTGPIQKESLNLAGHHFSGHTEIYAHYTGTEKYAMLLAEENIKVIHVTTHVSLKQACDLIRKSRIVDVIKLLEEGLQKLGIPDPRIGVAGLNPHSGEGGLFGDEEINEISPAVMEARELGIDVEGPVPADSLFALASGGKYDGCVAMYHDQGHIPFKLMGFNWDRKNKTMKSVKGVNISLGLPIIRTSVDHGTAFEIAGKGKASPDAMKQAIEYAIKLVN